MRLTLPVLVSFCCSTFGPRLALGQGHVVGIKLSVTGADANMRQLSLDVDLETQNPSPNSGFLGYQFKLDNGVVSRLLSPNVWALEYGDGTELPNQDLVPVIQGPTGHFHASFTHTYPAPGRYRLRAQAFSELEIPDHAPSLASDHPFLPPSAGNIIYAQQDQTYQIHVYDPQATPSATMQDTDLSWPRAVGVEQVLWVDVPCTPTGTEPCDDGNACTENDACQNGACSGTPTDGASCDDGDLCTGPDVCAASVCGGPPTDCSSPDPCSVGECVPSTGACAYTFQSGQACDDGDPCSSNTVCTPDGCLGTWMDCSQFADPCHYGYCDGTDVTCHQGYAGDGAPCQAGLCQLVSSCQDGVCQDAPRDCSTEDDACHVGACDPADGWCKKLPRDAGTTCDDLDPCTEQDQCDSLGTCSGGQKDCSGANDACHVNARCAPNGDCVADEVDDRTACDDLDPCTVADQCFAGVCNGYFDDSASCDDLDPCTEQDHCDLLNGCAGNPKDCSSLDDDCNVGACDSLTGLCAKFPVADRTPCDDSDFCTEDDACAAGACVGAPACEPIEPPPPSTKTPAGQRSGCQAVAAANTGWVWILALLLGFRSRRRS